MDKDMMRATEQYREGQRAHAEGVARDEFRRRLTGMRGYGPAAALLGWDEAAQPLTSVG